MNHTPTPWKQHETEGKTFASIRSVNNETIADCGSRRDLIAQANASFIVTACNAHEELVRALEFARKQYQEHFENMPVAWQTVDNVIEQALAKAEVKV